MLVWLVAVNTGAIIVGLVFAVATICLLYYRDKKQEEENAESFKREQIGIDED